MPNSTTKAVLVFCDDGKDYVLKNGGGSEESGGQRVLVAEYICYLIAKLFYIGIPEHCFIILGDNFLKSIKDKEIAQQLKNSPGLCIGSEYYPWAEPFTRKCANLVTDKRMLSAIFGFDQFVYNYDRTKDNPNLLYDPSKKEALMIDHSSALWPWFDFAEDINAVVFSASEHILCREHMMNRNMVVKVVRDVVDDIISHYVDSVPGAWFTEEDKEFTGTFIRKILKSRRDNIAAILSGVSECKH